MPMPRRLPRLLLSCLLALPVPALALAADPLPGAAHDPLESSIAGEFALQAGQLPEAARRYLAAARALDDAVLAERATRIALLADQDALARQAYALWARLAPQPDASRRVVAATLAMRDGQRRAARRELHALLASGDDGWKHALSALVGAVGRQPKVVVALLSDLIDTARFPDQLEPWLGLGGLAQRLGEPTLVERVLHQVVRRFPGDPRVTLLRAQMLREAGELEQARALLVGLQAAGTLAPTLQWSLAGEFDALGDPVEAARILAVGPQAEVSYAQRAALLEKAKDTAALAKLYEEVKREASRPDPMRRLLLGQIAEALELHEEALAWYANVPNPEAQALARLRSASVLHALDRRQQAYAIVRAMQAEAALDREAQRNAYLLEADLRLKDKDPAGELDAYARGLAAFADDEALLYSRALMWERRDEIAKAEADFRRILVVSPDDVNALNALGYTLADRTSRYREALALIDRARVAEPGNAAIIDSYGWVLFRLGRHREALSHLRHAYALQKDAEIGSHLAQVLWVLGQRDEARRLFDEVRQLDPDNRSLRRALQETGA